MQYLIALAVILGIVVIVAYIGFRLLKCLFRLIAFLVKTCPYFCFSFALTVMVYFVYDVSYAVFCAIVLVGLRVATKIVLSVYRRIKVILGTSRVTKFKRYLEKNFSDFGYTNVDKIAQTIPKRFKKYMYPESITCIKMIRDFLRVKTNEAYKMISDLVLEDITKKGMDEIKNVYRDVKLKFVGVTYSDTYEAMFSRVIAELEVDKIIDRPDNEKKAIHLIGATKGENFKQVDLNRYFN